MPRRYILALNICDRSALEAAHTVTRHMTRVHNANSGHVIATHLFHLLIGLTDFCVGSGARTIAFMSLLRPEFSPITRVPMQWPAHCDANWMSNSRTRRHWQIRWGPCLGDRKTTFDRAIGLSPPRCPGTGPKTLSRNSTERTDAFWCCAYVGRNLFAARPL